MQRKRCSGAKHVYSTKLSPEERVCLYSAYLGKVDIPGAIVVNGKVKANSDVNGIRIKIVDAVQHHLNPDICYPLRYLDSLDCVTIDLYKNRAVAYILLHLRLYLGSEEPEKVKAKIAQMEKDNENDETFKAMNVEVATQHNVVDVLSVNENNTKFVQDKYRDAFAKLLIMNSYVDIWFNTHRYVDFLSEIVKRKGINDDNLLLSVANVRGLDNAFWNGSYMTYGDGDVLFYPLVAPDIIAHELTHGLIQSTADLKYQGEPGALNESFADIAATSFEFFLYHNHEDNMKHINDMLGKPDWKIGEDNIRSGDNLRSMERPEDGMYPQPSVYEGRYWVNTHSSDDNGGVHTNSGVCNHLFYLVTNDLGSKGKDIFASFELFYATLCMMVSKSDYADLARCLIDRAKERDEEDVVVKNIRKLRIPMTKVPPPISRPPTPMPQAPPPSPYSSPARVPPSIPSIPYLPLPHTVPSDSYYPQTYPQTRYIPYPSPYSTQYPSSYPSPYSSSTSPYSSTYSSSYSSVPYTSTYSSQTLVPSISQYSIYTPVVQQYHLNY